MKHVFTTISCILLAGGLGVGAASAMPRLDTVVSAPIATPAIETVRLVCNYRRCFRTGYRYAYRPYGYYRPYYYRPHLGIGIGPFGVGIY